ncbi:MAG TPA: penicillin acylase family protein [Steroidobacteraceae bacterium]
MYGIGMRKVARNWRLPSHLLAAVVGGWSLWAAQTASADHEVHMYRDSVGMAHLYADREQDAFYGLGYASGEDRLEQVLTLYVAVRGELAATFGPKTPALPGASPSAGNAGPLSDAVASDLAARRFRLLETARNNFPKLPHAYQRDLQGYIAGLRAYMREHPERTPEWAPPLEPSLPLALLHVLVNEAAHVCDARRAQDAKPPPTAFTESAERSDYGPLGGSNAWAVSGRRTADGGVIFESDSHGPIETYGTLFYPYRIKAADVDFTAFAPAGTALFFFGHSPFFAWGITEGPRFPADCYRVIVEHGSPRQFKYDGHLQKMTVVPYSIAVKGGTPVTGVFEYTHHNGVTSPVVARDGDIAYVVSYASADRVGLGAGEYYRMAKARSRSQLESALAQRDAYPANLVIGGADGTIMYLRPGRIPVRPAGLDFRRTLDGNHSSTAWRGVHSYAETLKLIDPPQGFVANSNVSPDMMYATPLLKVADYPGYFGFDPGQTNSRQRRLIELLDKGVNGAEAGPQVTMHDAMAIAMDEMIADARPWGAAIAQAMQAQHEQMAAQPPELTTFMQALTDFDGVFSKESRGALAHYELRMELHERQAEVAKRLDEDLQAGRQLTYEQQHLLIEASAAARQRLLLRFGRTDLTWGDVHRVGRGGVDLAVGGGRLLDAASLRALSFAPDAKTGRERLIGGQRVPFIVHFSAAGAQCYSQTLLGVSDDPASAHYSDQARLASDKLLRPIPQNLAALKADKATERVLTVN